MYFKAWLTYVVLGSLAVCAAQFAGGFVVGLLGSALGMPYDAIAGLSLFVGIGGGLYASFLVFGWTIRKYFCEVEI